MAKQSITKSMIKPVFVLNLFLNFQNCIAEFISPYHRRILKRKVIVLNNLLLISLLYFLILTPISLILKLFGKSFLEINQNKVSYWVAKKNKIDYKKIEN